MICINQVKRLAFLILIALALFTPAAHAANTINVTYTDKGNGFGVYDYSISYDKPADLYWRRYLSTGEVLESKLTVYLPGYDGSINVHNPINGTKLIERVEFVLKDRETGAVVLTKGGIPYPPPYGSGSGGGNDPGGGDGGTGGTDPGGGSGSGGGTGGSGSGGGNDPGGGSGGGDGGTGGTDPGSGSGNCSGCELLACPGWEDLTDQLADKIGDKIPPPPDWEEVAEIFGDELVPRFERAMERALEDTLGHPPPPPEVSTPDISTPQANDSMPPAQTYDFSGVPNITVNPDTTGGIDLRNADPTDKIPHDAPDYMPAPGKETGGIAPRTKPVETPVPSDGGVPQPPENSLPTPGASSGEMPIPDATSDPPPAPELPMPE